MCRFFSYLGNATLMLDAMYHAENSLVEQSKCAKKRRSPVNGDGFGIGWYPTHDDPEPGCYVSTKPAWSDQNLLSLCSKIKTACYFAHVRDASVGMSVSSTNCHPFRMGSYLWMHNGELKQFYRIKRAVINELSDRAFLQIRGSTDSEFVFALFLDEIQFNYQASLEELQAALINTMQKIKRIEQACEVSESSFMNFVVSNGHCLISTRYSTNKSVQPPSLFYSTAQMEVGRSGQLFLHQNEKNSSVIITSEPITDDKKFWHKVERNQMIIVNAELKIKTKDLSF
ncbi:class II glutamine amidotransferase [Aliikangiella maris]|uniref:Class II glutamine amidotransferase n=2 Tax=Aliikangiella maris TaxID=3162458 RepID=A0ABV2BXN8_9GAMM